MTHDPNASSPSPTVITAERLSGGNVRLRWTGPVGDGTRYQVWRQFDESGPFTQLGCEVADGVGGGAGLEANTFTDTSVPPDTKTALYYVVTFLEGHEPGIRSDEVTVYLSAFEAA